MRGAALFLLAALVSPCCTHAQTKVDRGMALDRTAAIRIYNNVGTVRVIAWNRDSVAFTGMLGKGDVLHTGGTRQGMKAFIESADERNPAPANLEVMVPAHAKVWIKTATAVIDVRGVTGSLDLYIVGGEIRVSGNPADVNAEAIDGSITINGSPAWARAKSASGDVTFKGSSPDITVSTVSGNVSVSGNKFERAKFESVTGSIRFAGTFEPGGLVNFDSHSGSIDLSIPSTAGADFDVVSIAGSIVNKLTSKRPVPGRYGRGAELNTSNAGGGTTVVIRTFKGPVSLRTGN
jgi:hypothetical protein